MPAIQHKATNVENEAQDSKNLAFRFYKVMHYPLPLAKDFFAYVPQKKSGSRSLNPTFSRKTKPQIMSDFLAFLQKWDWLLKYFPFVEEIYLANSITFNALHSQSDIDLFVITKPKRIRIARLFMTTLFSLFGVKRAAKAEYQKFCLSFFVDREHCQLESLLLHEKDIYLPYWIAHLVPWYQEQRNQLFFEQNAWILRFLPYFPKKQAIFLGNKVISGRGSIKKIIEFLLYGKIGDVFEQWIEKLWLPRMKRLQKKNPELHQGVVIADGILKFHHDKREKYSKLFFS